jgi:hypothetical protein
VPALAGTREHNQVWQAQRLPLLLLLVPAQAALLACSWQTHVLQQQQPFCTAPNLQAWLVCSEVLLALLQHVLAQKAA